MITFRKIYINIEKYSFFTSVIAVHNVIWRAEVRIALRAHNANMAARSLVHPPAHSLARELARELSRVCIAATYRSERRCMPQDDSVYSGEDRSEQARTQRPHERAGHAVYSPVAAGVHAVSRLREQRHQGFSVPGHVRFHGHPALCSRAHQTAHERGITARDARRELSAL